MDFKTVIGLEIHVELATKTKMFCACPSAFGGEPNSRVCPTCLGLPGTLPVLNQTAIHLALKAALALDCKINETSIFARKNYFYPDLPKGYQITQDANPLAQDGRVELDQLRVGITRLHIEEDAGKSIHTPQGTLLDFNRSGTPLAEIVTEPCIGSPQQARQFLEALKQILQYTGVSDCKMEEGSLRCDANISLSQNGSPGTRTEIKNLNSFKAVEKALEYEVERHKKLLEQGQEVRRETLRWDETKSVTVAMRSKEEAIDYRYFPEPDLPPLHVSQEWIEQAKQEIPELPEALKKRLMGDYGLTEYDATVLTKSPEMSQWLEKIVLAGTNAKSAANWLTGEISRHLKDRDIQIDDLPFSPGDLAKLIQMQITGRINHTAARQVLAQMLKKSEDPEQIAGKLNLIQEDEGIEELVQTIIAQHADAIQDLKDGKDRALGFLTGQAMKLTGGRVDPQKFKDILMEKIHRKD